MLLFFFNDTATTEIYTLSLHDALPIFIDLGLASSDPVIIDGARVVPRRLLGEMLLRRLPADEPDVVLIRLEFRGTNKEGGAQSLRYDIIDRFDERTGLSAMMRTTAFPASIVAQTIDRKSTRLNSSHA